VEEIGRKLRDIYATHVPDKLSDVPKLMTKYAGKEAELLDRVMKKYGVSAPATSAATENAAAFGTPAALGGGKTAGDNTAAGTSGLGFGGLNAALLGAADAAPLAVDTAAKPGTSLFGSTSTTGAGTGAASSLFGSSTPGKPTATPTPFGAPAAASTSLFGSKTPVSSAASAIPLAPASTGGIGSLFSQPAAGLSSTPTPATGDSAESILQRVTAIYTQHNPSKLAEIPTLMEKYRGQEAQLLAKLEKKYGVTPSGVVAQAPSTPSSLFGGATGLGGFGAGTATTPKAGGLFGAPAAAAAATTPTGSLFGGPVLGVTIGGGAGGTTTPTPNPFGNTGAGIAGAGAGGTVPSPFGGSAGTAGHTTPSGGIGSLFGT
jgi:hypothetical protein